MSCGLFIHNITIPYTCGTKGTKTTFFKNFQKSIDKLRLLSYNELKQYDCGRTSKGGNEI